LVRNGLEAKGQKKSGKYSQNTDSESVSKGVKKFSAKENFVKNR